MEQGYIYFVGPEHGDGPIKIGFARNPEKRLQRIQTGHPEPLIIWARIWGTMDDEKQLHGHFRFVQARNNGEWFLLTDEIRLLLEALGNGVSYELPPRVRSKKNIRHFMERFNWLFARLDGPDPIEQELLAAQKRALMHL